MDITGQAKLLRIFLGESDKVRHRPLYEVIVEEARQAGLAGATVWRGILAYGRTSRIHTTKLLDLSADLPIVVELVDEEAKIETFVSRINRLFEEAQCGGLVTKEKVEIIQYAQKSDR